MSNIIEENGRLASLAVFRELYDSEKDIYGVISCFLTETITSNAKHKFSLHEITCLLNDEFNFHIPEAVVKASLGRIVNLRKDQGYYFADLLKMKTLSLVIKKEDITKNNNIIIEQLLEYISEQKKIKLETEEQEKIIHSFCSFILDKTNGQEYSEYISAFIISKQEDLSFINKLNCIKEGVVLYTGIMFNENISSVGSWNTELTIFLETEMLFHYAGFNGALYKVLFDEFLSFVREINAKANKPLIKLRYFPQIKGEIEMFFRKAEFIINGSEKVNPRITAMTTILNGCGSCSDVIEKKAKFFLLLDSANIFEDDYLNYYDQSNHKYNIVDQLVIKSITDSVGVDDISDNLDLLNYVNIRRNEFGDKSFEFIKYILLSGNAITLQVAWNSEIRKSGRVPLATSLSFLTNKFWFKLNKGFGSNSFPKTFDVITKAQILLSSQLNETVGKRYEDLQKKFKKGELNDQQAALTINELRKLAKKPEEIKKDDLTLILGSISEDSIDRIVEEQELFKDRVRQYERENSELKIEQEKKDAQNIKQLETEQEVRKILKSKSIKFSAELLLEKKANIQVFEKVKNDCDQKIKFKVFVLYKLIPILLSVFFYFIWLILIVKYGWGNIEPWTYLAGLVPPILIVIISLVQEKTFNPSSWLENRKKKCVEKMYCKFAFDSGSYQKALSDVNNLEHEISDLISQE